MAPRLWCGWLDCQAALTDYAAKGEIPIKCPACARIGKWTTSPPPSVEYDLSVNDKRFLKSLKIDPEG